MSKDFTLEELHYKISHLTKLANDPRVTEAHRKMYREGAAEFQRQFDELKAQQQQAQQGPSQPPGRQQAVEAPAMPRKAEDRTPPHPEPERVHIATVVHPPKVDPAATVRSITIETAAESAELYAPAKIFMPAAPLGLPQTVTITWWDGTASTLSEGDCRWKLEKALAEMAASTAVQQERWNKLRGGVTFHRALGYYQALTKVWEREPTAKELKIDFHPGSNRAKVWNMILEHAKQTQ